MMVIANMMATSQLQQFSKSRAILALALLLLMRDGSIGINKPRYGGILFSMGQHDCPVRAEWLESQVLLDEFQILRGPNEVGGRCWFDPDDSSNTCDYDCMCMITQAYAIADFAHDEDLKSRGEESTNHTIQTVIDNYLTTQECGMLHMNIITTDMEVCSQPTFHI